MKNKQKIHIFILGAACFFVSQQLLRIPLLSLVFRSPWINVFSLKHGLIVGILVAMSAGLFEESFRFLAVGLLKKREGIFWNPFFLGLGHSAMEIIFLFFMSGVSLKMISGLAILERIVATILHVEMAILIWNGFTNNRKFTGLLLAILFHGLVDAIIPLASYFGLGAASIEVVFIAFVCVFAIFLKCKWIEGEEI